MSSPPLRTRLRELVERFAGTRVAVAGDFVLDRFVLGLPKRISREAPVLILKYTREENVLGGGANTVANIASLGGSPIPAGAVGNDAEGDILVGLLEAAGVDTSRLLRVEGYPTPTKTRILGGSAHSIKQQVVRIDREGRLSEEESIARALRERVGSAAGAAPALVLCDYGYGSCRPEWIALGRKVNAGLSVFVDSRYRLLDYSGADAATPNEEELERAWASPIDDDDAAFERAARHVLSRLDAPALLVTRGSRGMALLERDAATVSVPVFGTDQVADVTGAGDTVIATFALARAAGATHREAALLSNFAGGVVVMKMGTATVSPEELREAIDRDRSILGDP
ncbi:MAG: bifunctional heptose 7-phosphate kinase/heptose 1-phosphate adenyltransferase [Thermoanaerobaculia bacterium]